MRPRLLLPLVLPLLAPPGCRAVPEGAAPPRAAILARWMTGSFSSAAQAAAHPGEFSDIRLFTVPIWADRPDGPWLYVEQAAADSLERPYRQRVYHLVDTPEGPRSDVYELPGDPLLLAGAWRDPDAFDALDPAQLSAREGCSIHLTAAGGRFEGSTRGTGCSSTLAGAAYATSEVTVRPDALTSWDRGLDAEGRQVWGATRGPYVFAKDVEPWPGAGAPQAGSSVAGSSTRTPIGFSRP